MNNRKIVDEYKGPVNEEEMALLDLDVDVAKHQRLVEAITRLLDNKDYKIFAAFMIGEKYDDDLAMLRKHVLTDPAKAAYYAGRVDLLEGLKDPRPFRDLLARTIAMKKAKSKASKPSKK